MFDHALWPWVQGGIGLVLFAGSWFIPEKRKSQDVPIQTRTFTARWMMLLGLGTWLFEFYTAVPFFGAIGIMTSAGLSPTQWLLLLGVYIVIMVLPGVVIYLAWLLLRERMGGRLAGW